MKTLNPNIKNNYFLIVLFLVLLAAAIYFLIKEKKAPAVVLTPNKTHEIPGRPADFNQGVGLFVVAVKKARVAVVNNNHANVNFFVDEALIVWRDVLNEFINTPPTKFKEDLNWTKNISSIYEAIYAAQDFTRQNKYELIADKLDESRSLINNVYNEDNDKNTDRQLFSLLLLVKKVSAAKTMDEAKSNLAILKFDYTNLKNLADYPETRQLFLDFETIISEIDNATPATFSRSQNQLMPVFIKIYEKF